MQNFPCIQATQESTVLFEGAPSNVSLHVKCEVVGPGESPLAHVALERPVSGVLAVMTREFVRARELPPATFPAAVVGLLTCGRKGVSQRISTHSYGKAAPLRVFVRNCAQRFGDG